jgi:NAD(P)-dependent dehydrogenase (short-subunit alcohol dehydrogenase family)
MSGFRVRDKAAIVTGAARGIGRASATALAREGAKVLLADLDGEGAKAAAEAIRAQGGEALGTQVDVGDESAVEAMVAAAVEAFGGLHVLHNNAALTGAEDFAKDASITEMTVEAWDRFLAIDLRSVMLGCKHAIPHMLEGGGGSIINTSSNQSLAGDCQGFAYAAAKGGVNSLTITVATAYGKDGIRCNAITPALILTDTAKAICPPEVVEIHEQNNLVPRVGQPEDIAQLVVYLASDESSFITGQILRVDGGQLAHLPAYAQMREAALTTTRR